MGFLSNILIAAFMTYMVGCLWRNGVSFRIWMQWVDYLSKTRMWILYNRGLDEYRKIPPFEENLTLIHSQNALVFNPLLWAITKPSEALKGTLPWADIEELPTRME